MSLSSGAKRHQPLTTGSPRWSVIWLMYVREMRDQLRDRRTLFTIAVLPILLYPLVGMLLLQIAQFTRQQPTSVCVVGTDHLSEVPPLLDTESFTEGMTDSNDRLELLNYRWDEIARDFDVETQASRWVRDGTFDVVVVIPPEFADPALRTIDDSAAIRLLYNVGSDQSMVARDRVDRILSTWRGGWVRERLTQSGIDVELINPFN